MKKLDIVDNELEINEDVKANFEDAFEELYLRHELLKRVGEFNQDDLKKYEAVVKVTSKIMYDKFKITYNKVGFAFDDIVSISRVYLYIYLGVYSFKVNPEKYTEFKTEFIKRKGKEPTEAEMEKSERNIIINFMRQKLGTCATFCERKSRNIVVGRNETKTFAFTVNSIPASEDLIMSNPKLFGYRILSQKEQKSIKKKFSTKELMADKDGFRVFEIERLSQIPTSINIQSSSDDSESGGDMLNIIPTQSVEEEILEMEEDNELDVNRMRFESLETSKRRLMLRNFISKNNNNKHLKEELGLAKKMLKTIGAVV